jgi:hypothetical protein
VAEGCAEAAAVLWLVAGDLAADDVVDDFGLLLQPTSDAPTTAAAATGNRRQTNAHGASTTAE